MNRILWVKCECNDYNKLIKKLNTLNLNLYEIKKNENYVYLKLNYESYEKLEKYLISYKFIIDKEYGVFSFISFLKKYFIYLCACFLGLVLFFFCNQIIIDVDVIHENQEIRELVFDALKEKGVKILTLKKSYKTLNEIRQQILDDYPDKLDWIEIETHGMKYVVKVEERIITNPIEESVFCDVYAKEAGLITDIKVTKGVSVVSKGDYVNVGDLLITGNIVHNEEIKSQVCAAGEVFAEKWYQVAVSLPLKYEEKIKTGKKKYNFVFENDDIKKRILRSRIDLFDSELVQIFSLFGQNFYLEKQYEIIKHSRVYNEEEALNKSVDLALEKVKIKLKEKERIIDKKVLKKVLNNSTMDVEVFIVTDEVISN